MDKSQLLYMGIELVILCIPIATLIRNYGKQSEKIEEHDRKIANLESLVNDKLDTQIDDIKGDVREIKNDISWIKEKLK